MLSYVLIIAAVVLFIGGILYLVVSNFKESKGAPAVSSDEGKTGPLSILSKQVAAAGESAAPVAARSADRALELEQQLRVLQERAAVKSAADQETIANLIQENSKLKKQIEQKESESGRLAAEIEAMRLSYERLKAEEGAKIQDFRQEITKMEEELKTKNEALERFEEEKAARIDHLAKELGEARDGALSQQARWQAERERLTAEHANLLARAGEHDRQMEQLKKDLELMQKINNQKLNEANDMVHLLQAQKSESDRIQQDVLGKQLAQALGKVGELNQERDHLMQARVALEENLGKTRDFNAYLLEKENVLQYELTKQRAQALGLEKICEDFKIQIDELTKAAVAN